MLGSSLFHLYDTRVAQKIRALHESWGITLSFDQHYHSNFGGDHIFSNPGDMPLSPAQQRDWNKIEAALKALGPAKEALLMDLRRRYLEIDIDALSQAAWRQHAQFEKEVRAGL